MATNLLLDVLDGAVVSRTFKSGDDRVSDFDDDFKDVAAVVGTGSRWIPYLGKNVQIAIDAIKYHSFNVVSSGDFQKLGQDADAAGLTDKQTGKITLLEFFGVNSHAALLVAAVHEFVHLVSHPPKQGVSMSSAKGFLGEGLHEGLVQVVAEDILDAQKITPSKHKAYEARVAIVRRLLDLTDIKPFGNALFQGQIADLRFMHDMYTIREFQKIQKFAKVNDSKSAIDLLNKPVQSYAQRKVK